MSAHDIRHELEPPYPYDRVLNVNGLRADWLLADGTFVEASGMTTDVTYQAKIERKRHLARQVGINLVIVTEADLSDLPGLLGRLAGR
jgi:hypothetical protein